MRARLFFCHSSRDANARGGARAVLTRRRRFRRSCVGGSCVPVPDPVIPRARLTGAPAGGALAAASGSLLEDRGSILVGTETPPIRHTTTRVGFQEMLLLLVPVLWLHQRTGAAPSGSSEPLDAGAVSSLPSDFGVVPLQDPDQGSG